MSAGEATPNPAPVLGPRLPPLTRGLDVAFDFRPNAGSSQQYLFPQSESAGALRDYTFNPVQFVGLTPGQVGLYQINVRLPEIFPAVLPCGYTFLR